ncbi:hypothetical protein ACU610_21340 [Geodermatophilus sp. URMC 61]|uniref:hypothetical protein n=1 Tax=Geodermatophilus sp. URMC 61 TaxID=3423411 RepID=UPI00406C3BFE
MALEYQEYLQQVDRAADATGGKVVSLAGGYFGVQLDVDGAYLLLALDLDSEPSNGWVAWTEDRNGERCCDEAEEVVGSCDVARLRDRAIAAIGRHVHAV